MHDLLRFRNSTSRALGPNVCSWGQCTQHQAIKTPITLGFLDDYPALHADITPQIVVQAQIASHRSVPCVFLLGIYFDEDIDN